MTSSTPIKAQVVPPRQICHAAMGHTTYRTGDGEVVQQIRTGSQHALTLPSRGTT